MHAHCESFYVYICPPVQQHVYRKCVLILHLTIQMMVAATEGGLNTIGKKSNSVSPLPKDKVPGG